MAKKIKAIICGESTADGVNLFLAENEKAANFYARVTDVVCGAPGEVDHWGGWHTDMDAEDIEAVHIVEFDGDNMPSKQDLIAAVLASGVKPATVAECKKLLVKDNPDYPDGGFDELDVWGKYIV